MKNFLKSLRDILKYPSAIFGSVIVLALVIASIVIVIKIPYNEAINKWRGGEEVWGKNPRNAPPAWTNWFTKDKLV
jgi:peptide/nickel transport system permease protein